MIYVSTSLNDITLLIEVKWVQLNEYKTRVQNLLREAQPALLGFYAMLHELVVKRYCREYRNYKKVLYPPD
jgi:hypothetical protein